MKQKRIVAVGGFENVISTIIFFFLNGENNHKQTDNSNFYFKLIFQPIS